MSLMRNETQSSWWREDEHPLCSALTPTSLTAGHILVCQSSATVIVIACSGTLLLYNRPASRAWYETAIW